VNGASGNSLLQAGDHFVLRKLANELLPWLIGGQTLGKQWFVRLASTYNYIADIGAALAGLGIGSPIVKLMQGKAQDGENFFAVIRSALPPEWYAFAIVGGLVYVVMRVIIQQQNVTARALLAREYSRGFKASYAQLLQALAQADPMPQILVIQKSVDDRVQDAIKNEVWPFEPLLPDNPAVRRRVNQDVVDFRTRYMGVWTPAPATEQRT
jgi:hypothetical protein